MKKRKFTWLDGVVIGVLVLAVAAAGIWYVNKDQGGEPAAAEKDYRLTVQFTQISEIEMDGYKEGDTLYFQNRAGVLGTIESIQLKDKFIERYDAKAGKYVVVIDPKQKLVEMTVLVKGVVENGKFTVNEKDLSIGQTFYPQTDVVRSVMTIWDIEEVAA